MDGIKDYVKEQSAELPTLCLITFPFPNMQTAGIGTRRLIQIFTPLSSKIFLITGNYPWSDSLDSKVRFIDVKNNSGRRSRIARVLNYMTTELKLAYHFVGIAKKTDIIIIGAPSPALPTLVAWLLHKRIFIFPAGSVARSAKQQYSGGLLSYIRIYIFSFMEKLNYMLASKIVIYSERLIDHFGVQEYKNKILVARNHFIDLDKFKPQKRLGERDNVIGFIGRFSAEKGIMNFMQAIPLILRVRKDAKFLIGGEGPLREDVEKYIKAGNLAEFVRFEGWISHETLPDYLNRLKLLVLPSYSEGLPNTIMEAMACGTPVLATAVGAIADMVVDNETGFILQTNSPGSIAEDIIRALSYPKLDEMTEKAHTLILKEYTLDSLIHRYKDIFDNINKKADKK